MPSLIQWILGTLLIASSLGVITTKKPVHSSLYFLFALMMLALYYLQLSAELIAVMQILVYAGAILVIFMFVIVLFQDAHEQVERFSPKSKTALLLLSAGLFVVALLIIGKDLVGLRESKIPLPQGFGMVEPLGKALYLDFFFPFEAVTLLFLVAVVGALFIGKKGE